MKSLTHIKPFFAGGILLFLAALSFAFIGGDDSFELAKQEILLREIGHELLLTSGDSTSRVLPVTRVGEGEYELRFENSFSFKSDSLIGITARVLKKNRSQQYIVNVLDCSGTAVLFGYAMLGSKRDDVIACSGRTQPKRCYVIRIKFQPGGATEREKGYLLGSVPLLALVGLIVVRSRGTRKNRAVAETSAVLNLGRSIFDPAKRQLITGELVTELTSKEAKLLLLLTRSMGQLVERTQLQKELWEDEGVIVGRSLDVFISRLRKKLEHDDTVHLVNIHGKGYLLKVTEGV